MTASKAAASQGSSRCKNLSVTFSSVGGSVALPSGALVGSSVALAQAEITKATTNSRDKSAINFFISQFSFRVQDCRIH